MAISRPVLYGLIGIIAFAGWYLTEPDNGATSKAAKPKSAASKGKDNGVMFTDQDYKARYAALDASMPNVFKPIVARSTGPSSELLSPNSIPADFAGGDPNWIYTGMATVDGLAMGLVENGASGDGEFLTISQHWKKARVLKITAEALVMESDRGVIRTMTLKNYDDVLPPIPTEGIVEPVNPLQGPIGDGNGVAVRPTTARPLGSNGAPTETSDEH